METVGEILKKTREFKNLTLSDVSNDLKISKDILLNFENNNPQNDIAGVFIIGHLRSYCSYLNLNYNELVNQFKIEHFKVEGEKIEIEKIRFDYTLLFSNKLLSFSLILIILFSFYFLFIEIEDKKREYAIIPDLPENYVSVVEKANLNKLVENKKNKNDKNFAQLETTSNSSSAIASLPDIEDQKSSTITLKFLDDTWFQIRDENDEIIFSQLMNKNDEYSYDLNQNYSITSGNAGHIMVMIDQKVRGKIGNKGQVVDSLVISKDFNN